MLLKEPGPCLAKNSVTSGALPPSALVVCPGIRGDCCDLSLGNTLHLGCHRTVLLNVILIIQRA